MCMVPAPGIRLLVRATARVAAVQPAIGRAMIDSIRREIARAMAGARSAIRSVLQGIAIAQRIQRVNCEGLAGEPLQDVELMQQFGFTSAPPAGAQLVVVPLGGRTSASVIVATEHGTYRLQLGAQGEAAIYNQWGDAVHLKQDRSIHVVAVLKVVMDTPLLQVNGQIKATGNITSDADVRDQAGTKSMAGMRTVFNAHSHADTHGGSVSLPYVNM